MITLTKSVWCLPVLVIQMKRTIEIPITNDMVPEKDECFEIELTDPTGGAVLGQITKMAVTITNDEGTCVMSY